MGIEPTLFAWEARVLPLNDTRTDSNYRVAQYKPDRLGGVWLLTSSNCLQI